MIDGPQWMNDCHGHVHCSFINVTVETLVIWSGILTVCACACDASWRFQMKIMQICLEGHCLCLCSIHWFCACRSVCVSCTANEFVVSDFCFVSINKSFARPFGHPCGKRSFVLVSVMSLEGLSFVDSCLRGIAIAESSGLNETFIHFGDEHCER